LFNLTQSSSLIRLFPQQELSFNALDRKTGRRRNEEKKMNCRTAERNVEQKIKGKNKVGGELFL
jgi:hypothetical protein